MKFAPVLPPKLGMKVDDGDYHMVQAFSFTEQDSPEVAHYKEWGIKDPSHYVILDNGVYELGGLAESNINHLFDVADWIWPDEIVCPDAIQDMETTLELFKSYLPRCTRYPSVMVVPQGHAFKDWVYCADQMLDYCIGSWGSFPIVGVPKYLETYPTGRLGVVSWLCERGVPQDHVHLLGIQSHLTEALVHRAHFPEIRGVDSTWPFAQAQHGICNFYDKYSPDWKGEYDEKLVEYNIKYCRTWVDPLREMPF